MSRQLKADPVYDSSVESVTMVVLSKYAIKCYYMFMSMEIIQPSPHDARHPLTPVEQGIIDRQSFMTKYPGALHQSTPFEVSLLNNVLEEEGLYLSEATVGEYMTGILPNLSPGFQWLECADRTKVTDFLNYIGAYGRRYFEKHNTWPDSKTILDKLSMDLDGADEVTLDRIDIFHAFTNGKLL